MLYKVHTFHILVFITELYDSVTPNVFEESTPYEVPVQTLHNPITSKSHPGNLNEDDIYTALEDIESNEKGLYEQEDNDNAIEGELPSPLYFTLDQVNNGFDTFLKNTSALLIKFLLYSVRLQRVHPLKEVYLSHCILH